MNLQNYFIIDSNGRPIAVSSLSLIKREDYESNNLEESITLLDLFSLLPDIQQ